MADTKISAGTSNPSPALTDKFPIYSAAQTSSDKYVNTLQQTKDLLLGGAFYTTGEISPSQVTSSQNDWNPTGLSTCTHINVNTDNSAVSITGITAPSKDNTFLTLYNNGSTNVLFPHESSSSTAANRFKLSVALVSLQPGHCLKLVYDSTVARWVEIANTSSSIWIPDPRTKFVNINECSEAFGGNTPYNNNSGTGTVPAASTTGIFSQKALGVYDISTGSTTTGRSGFTLSNLTAITCALGRYMGFARVAINSLSTVSEEYTLKILGFSAYTTVPSVESNGIFWAYERAVDGDFFTCFSCNNSSRTKTVTSLVPSSTFIYLGIVTNADWTLVEFISSSDGITWTRQALHDSGAGANNPTTARTAHFGVANIIKSAGSTARILSIDNWAEYYNFLRA